MNNLKFTTYNLQSIILFNTISTSNSSNYKIRSSLYLRVCGWWKLFFIGISADSILKVGYRVKVSFQIGLHEKDRNLLELIKSFFGVGSITKQGQKSIQIFLNPINI